MGKHSITSAMLWPKKKGLTGRNKPAAVILGSPHDYVTAAVRHSSAADVVEDHGYTLLNKRALLFGNDIAAKSIKRPQSKKQEITVWIESHGAPGWLFSGDPSPDAEMTSAIAFKDAITQMAKNTGLTVKSVVLSCCFSANEYTNPEESTYFISPARLLSILMPDCNILGFAGMNASAKVTGVYQREEESGAFKERIVRLQDMAVVFRAGRVLDMHDNEFYCNHRYTPEFITKACKVDLENLYQPGAAIRAIDSIITETKKAGVGVGGGGGGAGGCVRRKIAYGDWQITMAKAHLQAALLPSAAAPRSTTPKSDSVVSTTPRIQGSFFTRSPSPAAMMPLPDESDEKVTAISCP